MNGAQRTRKNYQRHVLSVGVLTGILQEKSEPGIMPILDEKDLIQVDATAIAGVLILLTLTSIASDVPTNISAWYSLVIGSFIVAAIIPFCISAIFILRGNFYPRPPQAYLRTAGNITTLGFAYLVVVVVGIVGFSVIRIFF